MKILLTFIASLAMVTIFAQKEVTTSIKLEDYTKLKLNGDILINVKDSSANFLELKFVSGTAKENHIEAEIEDKLLRVFAGVNFNKDIKVRATLYTDKNPASIETINGGRIYLNNIIKNDSIELKAYNGGIINAEVETNYTFAKTTSGGLIVLKGNSKETDLRTYLGATIDATKLNVNKVAARANTKSLIKVNPKKELSAEAGTGGTIIYSGNPVLLQHEENLGGTIIKE